MKRRNFLSTVGISEVSEITIHTELQSDFLLFVMPMEGKF